MSESLDATDGARCSCKVGRNARAYDLEGFDARLRERHAGGASLRDLERFVNETLLHRALEAVDADVIGDVASVYEALTDEDVSAGRRTEVRERLSQAGVDVEALRADFVSYGTVRTHLRDCLGVETTRAAPLSVDDARGTIEWARSRSEGIVDRTLDRLADGDQVAAGDLEVAHTVRVTCADCGISRSVEAFLDRGGCDCDPGVGGE
jgi:hypothetical protein